MRSSSTSASSSIVWTARLRDLKGNGSVIGGWLDYIFDRIRVLFCSIGLFGGLAYHTGNPWWIWLAFVVVFVDMLRYMDAMQISLVRERCTRQSLQLAEAGQTLSYLGNTPEEDNGRLTGGAHGGADP